MNCAAIQRQAQPGWVRATTHQDYAGVIVPLRLVRNGGILSFFSTTAVFGTPVDITLSELALESFFPADAATIETLRSLADA